MSQAPLSHPRAVCVVIVISGSAAYPTLPLECLHAQVLPDDVTLQVVVFCPSPGSVRDSLAEPLCSWPALTLVEYPADSVEGPAPPTLPLPSTSADFVLWLGADVCVPYGWVSRALTLAQSEDSPVVLGEILRLDASPSRDVSAPRSVADIGAIARSAPWLTEAWYDRRAAEFAMGSPALPQVLMPWALASADAILLRTDLCRRVGELARPDSGGTAGFAFRLAQVGASFFVQREPPAVGLSRHADDRLRTHRAMAEPLFKAHPCLETEAYLALGATGGALLSRLEPLPMEYVVPTYRSQVVDALRHRLVGRSKSLLVGASEQLARELTGVTDFISPSVQHDARLRAIAQGRVVRMSLGISLPYEDASIELAIVSDFFGGFCGFLQRYIFAELSRVARAIVFVCSPDIPTHARLAFGWAKTHPEMIRGLLQHSSRKLDARAEQVGPHLLLDLAP